MMIMGKEKREKLREKCSRWNENRKTSQELKLIAKENQAVYQLTCKLMKNENLTWDQVQECYK